MIIISSDYLLTCDEDFRILENRAVVFDQKIIEIDTLEVLSAKYPNAKVEQLAPNSVLMPGLVNVHVHLEFSANKTTLAYGDFITWLESVIAYRDSLNSSCDDNCIDRALEEMQKSGTTMIGAISSFGADLASCVKTPMHVIYFNEVLGSNPAAVDALYSDFLSRLETSQSFANDRFTPAISIHSPYSTHPILAKKALGVAAKGDMVVSTHFMESQAERDWLDDASGEFKGFFANFAPNARPVNDAQSYLELFKNNKVLFTHATKATQEELSYMCNIGAITHCPVSNRLLGNGRLTLECIEEFTLGTDGLSSNNSLSLWDEMRGALMMHSTLPLNTLAQKLLLAATAHGANALGQKTGRLVKGYDADIISVTLPDALARVEEIAQQLILHTEKVDCIYIKGESV
ncbi:MAG: metal-dependent hydrolase [Epsilonproteobacteria bacterium]|nr:metal-dependent hydrolase [Campylobacterota bacterium]